MASSNATNLQIQCVSFCQSAIAIQMIRRQVFHLEQGIPLELDIDGQDDAAMHLLAIWEQQPVGTARLRSLPDHTVKIERVAVLATYRQRGIGQQMMRVALTQLQQQPVRQVVVHAQQSTQKFYEKLGFVPVGTAFHEADIVHIKMVYQLFSS